jgi:hypothetical protein
MFNGTGVPLGATRRLIVCCPDSFTLCSSGSSALGCEAVCARLIALDESTIAWKSDVDAKFKGRSFVNVACLDHRYNTLQVRVHCSVLSVQCTDMYVHVLYLEMLSISMCSVPLPHYPHTV